MAGLTTTGFDIKTVADLLADFEAAELTGISASLDVQATALTGILNGIMAQAIAETWQLGQALYNGMDPDQATGDQLASLALITGTKRLAATKTLVVGATVNVGPVFSAAPGTMFASVVGNPIAVFTNKTAVSNPGGMSANETVDFEAINTGPIQCLAGTLTVISQPLSGWNSVTNSADGIIGTDAESDSNLRARRNEELSAAGSSTADAIKAAILKASDNGVFSVPVVSCTVLFNDTDATDANGVTPHAIECIVLQPGATSGDDQLLANLILASKGAGIGTHGTSSKTVTDSQGNTELVYYTRPTAVPIYIDITVKTNSLFPADGATQVKQALAGFGSGIGDGNTVYALHVEAEAFNVAGVLDVTAYTIDTVSPPVASSNITIGIRQIATFSTGDISVTVTT